MNITGIFPARSQKIRYGIDTDNDASKVNLLSVTKNLGSGAIFTFNIWIKIQTSLASERWIVGNGSEFSGDYFAIRCANTTITVAAKISGTTRGHTFTVTDMNNSAWHHIFVQLDTTQGTDTNRVKIWLDGAAQTPAALGTGYFTASQAVATATNSWKMFGYIDSGGVQRKIDLYAADPVLIDGSTISLSRFFRTTVGGNRPVSYRGPYGSKGFKLEFLNTSNFGVDTAGNGNWTESEAGGGAFAQVTSTPSG